MQHSAIIHTQLLHCLFFMQWNEEQLWKQSNQKVKDAICNFENELAPVLQVPFCNNT